MKLTLKKLDDDLLIFSYKIAIKESDFEPEFINSLYDEILMRGLTELLETYPTPQI
ncbi:sporulation histidine kinase inhibitor Sda [Paenibacillus sp. NPDC056579]|uniref:sporulation histidine kinase inhibitor Sda n=1 Tax=Paenibacillus sp. NPDC056579 TaxID=3345871 RepID=UPI0036CBB2C7